MSGNTTEADTMVRQSQQRYRLSEALTVLLLVPLIACYPLYYLTRDEDQQDALEDEFSYSPVSLAPGLESGDSLLVASGYGVALLVVAGGLVYATPFTALGALLTVVCGVIGAGVTLYLSFRGDMKRELAKRFGLSVVLGSGVGSLSVLAFVGLFSIPVSAFATNPMLAVDIASLPFVAVLLGATSGNAFVVKRNELHQRRKQRDDGDGDTESHIVTDSRRGESVRNSEGQALLERLAEQKWTAPDDLASAGSVQNARKIKPLRDIVRGLWVEEMRYEHAVAKSEFRETKRDFRTDSENRHNVAPSGFASGTYKYIFEDTVTERRCRECNGTGALSCGNCDGHGELHCGDCGGSGRRRCPKCNGEKKLVERETCGVCGGDGTNQRGYTCGNCHGDGVHEMRTRCPNCRAQGEVDCGNCRNGLVSCGTCSGSGEVGCGNCGTTGTIVEFDSLTRTYEPDKDVSYRDKSVPTRLLTDADGTRVDKDRDENPSQDGLYRREDETRKIPVTVATYEYLGDDWEVFDVEGALAVVDFPRDYAKQLTVVQAAAAILLPVFLLLVVGV